MRPELNVLLNIRIPVWHVSVEQVIHNGNLVSHRSRVVHVVVIRQDARPLVSPWQGVFPVPLIDLGYCGHDLIDRIGLVAEQFAINNQAVVIQLSLYDGLGLAVTPCQISAVRGQFDQHGFLIQLRHVHDRWLLSKQTRSLRQ